MPVTVLVMYHTSIITDFTVGSKTLSGLQSVLLCLSGELKQYEIKHQQVP